MRFIPYVAILIVGVGTMLLGAELMTLPQQPAAQLASAPNKLAQHIADQRAEKTEGNARRPLTPLYPANPGGTKDVRIVCPPSNQTQAANATTSATLADEPKTESKTPQSQQTQVIKPPQTNANVPQPPQESQPVRAEEHAPPKPVEYAANHCDMRACAGAYASFRASDCTYQPFEGARRLCTAPSTQRSAKRDYPRGVRPERITQDRRDTEPPVVELRRAIGLAAGTTDDDEDDNAPIANGQRVIVIERGDQPWQ
jgi:outer membrane biosynthesis protein TonB